uniref:Uncharacterized protein n=1 Tax=Denticeps clupeoides TaxID=299321 RepID=A0AAY4E873_9TELE
MNYFSLKKKKTIITIYSESALCTIDHRSSHPESRKTTGEAEEECSHSHFSDFPSNVKCRPIRNNNMQKNNTNLSCCTEKA